MPGWSLIAATIALTAEMETGSAPCSASASMSRSNVYTRPSITVPRSTCTQIHFPVLRMEQGTCHERRPAAPAAADGRRNGDVRAGSAVRRADSRRALQRHGGLDRDQAGVVLPQRIGQ